MDEELRIAVVMNGGVSLAVWIGGVTVEIGRVVAKEKDSAYGELQSLMGTTTRVDVICGTSAGGVNGAFLAMALAHCQKNQLPATLDLLRSLWVTKGSIAELLRDPFESDFRSLLDGDGYFLESLQQAFGALQSQPPSNPTEVPIDLVITTTLLRGMESEYSDDFGSRIPDVSHRGQFRFRRGPAQDDFASDTIANQLALAARSTASFPAAFEPSYCPVGGSTDQPARPDMGASANFKASRYVIDGGVLNNSPIDLALKSIFHQRAEGPVRRVLAYVIPDPGTTAKVDPQGKIVDTPDDIKEPPELLNVGLASLVQIPSAQSISSQLEELKEHNEKVRARRRVRVVLTQSIEAEKIDQLSETLFETYRNQRVADGIDYIVNEISAGLVDKRKQGLGRRGRREWFRRTITELAPRLPWVPSLHPTSPDAVAEQSTMTWRWGTRPVEHSARLLLDILIRTQKVAALLMLSPSLSNSWKNAYDILESVDELRKNDRQFWRDQAAKVLELLGDGKTQRPLTELANQWFSEAIAGWQKTSYQAAAEQLHKMASVLQALWAAISDIKDVAFYSTDRSTFDRAYELTKLFNYFVRTPNDEKIQVVGRLLAFEVTQDALGGRGTITEQELEFVQVSARSRSLFGGPDQPQNKIAGIQLAHFGAFYKSSWRANDWMWGRVDTVHRLVRILLDPERLRAMAPTRFPASGRAQGMADALAKIATNSSNIELNLEAEKFINIAALKTELAYLDDSSLIVPEQLPLAVEAISRRIEGEILCVELPRLADTVHADIESKNYDGETTRAFLNRCRAVTTSQLVKAAELRDLLSICEIGREKLQNEIGRDPLSTVATQAVAVAVSSVRNQKGLFALIGKMLTFLRAPALLFYLFARNLQHESKTGLVFISAAFAAGLAVLATRAFGSQTYSPWLLALGLVGVAGPVLITAVKFPRVTQKLLAVFTLLILVLLASFFLGLIGAPDWDIEIWQKIAVGSVALLILFSISQIKR